MRQNMNGAGAGGRLVGKRDNNPNGTRSKNRMKAQDIGNKSQLGSREQKRYDLRKALGVKM